MTIPPSPEARAESGLRAPGFSPRGRAAALTVPTLLSLACISLATAPGETPREFAHGAPAPTLTVMTWNVAHGRGTSRSQLGHSAAEYQSNINAVARVIFRESPDVVALQEADAPSAWSGSFNHVGRIVDAAGYPHHFHGLHFEAGFGALAARYGTAILSRRPLRGAASTTLVDRSFHTKGYVRAEVDLDGRPVLVVSLHLNSESKDVRLRQVDQLVEGLSGKRPPLIVMGDFNARWDVEDDAVRLVAERLRLRAFEPDATGLQTFRSEQPSRRIDWILISDELAFVNHVTLPDVHSDHLTVRATVRWK